MTRFEINKELNGIEVIFESKPAQAVIDSLKSNGFRWHRVKKLWYAKNTKERLALVESITGTKRETEKENKEASPLPSLWNRCKTDSIPEHCRTADTKTVAAETRKHIKERFPEIKFSCRIGPGGWAAANEVNFYFKSAPFEKDSIYFEAVRNYVKAWLWSFNYDNSDSMTDYFDRNFYENISTWDYEVSEPTEAQKADMEDFERQNEKAKEEEEKRREDQNKRLSLRRRLFSFLPAFLFLLFLRHFNKFLLKLVVGDGYVANLALFLFLYGFHTVLFAVPVNLARSKSNRFWRVMCTTSHLRRLSVCASCTIKCLKLSSKTVTISQNVFLN